jgi:hypothetical protein
VIDFFLESLLRISNESGKSNHLLNWIFFNHRNNHRSERDGTFNPSKSRPSPRAPITQDETGNHFGWGSVPFLGGNKLRGKYKTIYLNPHQN